MHDNDSELQEAYADVLGESKYDDAMVTVDLPDGQEISIEFVDFENPEFRGFNTAAFTRPSSVPNWLPLEGANRDLTPEDVAKTIELRVTDVGDIYLVLESEAECAEDALDELDRILTTLDVSRQDISSVNRRNIEQGGVIGWLSRQLQERLR